MKTFWLLDAVSAIQARQESRDLAASLGAVDTDVVEQVAGELACNCVEHRTGRSPGLMRIYREEERLVVETWNRCGERPDWRTRKQFGTGGYGLIMASALAERFDHSWEPLAETGVVRTRAEFPLRRAQATETGGAAAASA